MANKSINERLLSPDDRPSFRKKQGAPVVFRGLTRLRTLSLSAPWQPVFSPSGRRTPTGIQGQKPGWCRPAVRLLPGPFQILMRMTTTWLFCLDSWRGKRLSFKDFPKSESCGLPPWVLEVAGTSVQTGVRTVRCATKMVPRGNKDIEGSWS